MDKADNVASFFYNIFYGWQISPNPLVDMALGLACGAAAGGGSGQSNRNRGEPAIQPPADTQSLVGTLEFYGNEASSGLRCNYLVEVSSKDDKTINDIVAMYTQKFKDESWYKPPGENKDAKSRLSFPNENKAMNFFQEMANDNKKFIMQHTATGKIAAYSSADGVLHRNEDNLSLDEIREKMNSPPEQGLKM